MKVFSFFFSFLSKTRITTSSASSLNLSSLTFFVFSFQNKTFLVHESYSSSGLLFSQHLEKRNDSLSYEANFILLAAVWLAEISPVISSDFLSVSTKFLLVFCVRQSKSWPEVVEKLTSLQISGFFFRLFIYSPLSFSLYFSLFLFFSSVFLFLFFNYFL